MNQDKKIALLIDAENISRNYRKTIMNELAKYGTTTYRRIYGDFTSRTISWTSEDMLKYSLTPIQQYSNTSQKNKNDLMKYKKRLIKKLKKERKEREVIKCT